jgi:hypothetical protein
LSEAYTASALWILKTIEDCGSDRRQPAKNFRGIPKQNRKIVSESAPSSSTPVAKQADNGLQANSIYHLNALIAVCQQP